MKQPNEYSDDEIYEMLKPKLKKAGLNIEGISELEPFHIDRIIALAYRSGYIRAQKGRSFIIGEKKPTTKVRFIDNNAHKNTPAEFYPPVGTIGILLQENDNLFVDWGKNSGVEKGCGEYEYTWYCEKSQVEVIE